jgi:hypothetical protein
MPDSKNSKISELTELTTPVGADIVPIVDSSDAETKRITYTNLVASQPASTAVQAALDLKANIESPTFTGTVGGITKTMVGLGNVDNTSDADKPISLATQTALNTKGSAADVATNAANIASNDTDIATNAANIASNDTDIATNAADIATNTANIASNDTDIATNAANIASNDTDIATNAAGIAANLNTNNAQALAITNLQNADILGGQLIATNTADIATNATNIASNATNIGANAVKSLQNASGIATNSADIATNSADIATNSADIATNSADIATNSADIATNSADIATKAPLAQPNVQDSLTVTATVSPDEDSKVELIDKSTGITKRGGLYKKDGSLYVGTYTDYLKNLRCFQQGADQVYAFPNNSGIRFHGGDILRTYEHESFNPSLGVGGVAQTAYNNKTAYYTKFGRKVTFHIEMTIQAPDTAIKSLYTTNPTSNFEISGMPFIAQWDSTFILRPVQGFLNCSGVSFPVHAHMSNNTAVITFERGVEQSSASAGTGANVRDLQLNDFVSNPFDFVESGATNKFRFSLSGVYMSNED